MAISQKNAPPLKRMRLTKKQFRGEPCGFDGLYDGESTIEINAPVWKDVYGTNIGAYDNDVLGWFDYNNNQWNVFTADYRPRNTVSRNHDTWTGTCANNKYLSSCSSDNDCKDGDKDWGTCVEYESPTIVYDGTPSSIADIENAPPNK